MSRQRRHRLGFSFAFLVVIGSWAAWAGSPVSQVRLSTSEVAGLPRGVAGAGTSGVVGIETTVLSGDPTSAGPYTIALRVPAHTIIAAHTHRDDRSAVVVSGTWWFGYGSVNTPDQLKVLGPGSFYTEPGGDAHFARTGDEPAVIYVTGIGPTDTHYLDKDADPRH
jgi:quercetin dioxygenase-like cupin family protein